MSKRVYVTQSLYSRVAMSLITVDCSYGAVQDGAIFYTENDNVGTYLRLELPKHTPYHNLPGKLQNFHCECIEKMILICWISVVILLSIVLHICRNHIERQTRKVYLLPQTFANFKSDMLTIWHMPTVLPVQNLHGILWLYFSIRPLLVTSSGLLLTIFH